MEDSRSHTGSKGHDSKAFSETSSVRKGVTGKRNMTSHPPKDHSALAAHKCKCDTLCFPAESITFLAKAILKYTYKFHLWIMQD